MKLAYKWRCSGEALPMQDSRPRLSPDRRGRLSYIFSVIWETK